ncbi:MAG TPA: PAS domain-containing sensor histidine kinase, partial [Thermoanaerobaculia bacterium]|nr:PAS domain-containing sensor histidine kinase [Thermoanaerobaculia bacterium]
METPSAAETARPDDPVRHRLDRWLRFEVRLLLLALGAALPGALLASAVAWGRLSRPLAVTVSLAVLALAIGLPLLLFRRLEYTLNTLSNLLEALREGDFSLRARPPRSEGPMDEVMNEVNALGEILREQRLGAVEATVLLRKVMDAIDVAVFAFGRHDRLQLVNRAGARLLARAQPELVGRSAEELGLAGLLE